MYRMFRKTHLSEDLAVATLLLGGLSSAAHSQDVMEEITVTATRRATSIQDVPYNISATSGADLERANITDLGEYLQGMPGVNFVDVGARQSGNNSTITMRGLSADAAGAAEIPDVAQPSVSTYVGESPVWYNIKLTDLERVEVLRGPQGTLYGAGSLGGTIRFMPNKPTTDAVYGKLTASGSSTDGSGELNHFFDGMLNLPINDSMALRFSGGVEHLDGFVDAVDLASLNEDGSFALADPDDFVGSGPRLDREVKDSNDSDIAYLRSSLLWDINEDVSALLAYQYQDTEAGNYQAVHPDRDDEVTLRRTNPFEGELDMISLEVTADLGFATLTSATSHNQVETESHTDLAGFYETLLGDLYFNYPRMSAQSEYLSEDETFVQELRLSSNGTGPLSWIGGLFYIDQDFTFETTQVMPGYEDWLVASGIWDEFGQPELPLGRPYAKDTVYYQHREISFRELALFGEIGYQITDDWQVTVGARTFREEVDNHDTFAIPECFNLLQGIGIGEAACGAAPAGGATVRNSTEPSDSIFKVNSSYYLNQNTNAYITWSEGFRHGGVNGLPTAGVLDDSFGGAYQVSQYEFDKVTNMELGVKGSLWQTLRYSAAVFTMDWEQPQVNAGGEVSGIPGVFNATADAETRGLELDVSGTAGGLDYSFGYTWTQAEFTEDGEIYVNPVEDGTQLPNLSKNTLNGSVSYTMTLSRDLELGFHLSGSYRSDFSPGIAGSDEDVDLPSYTLWNGNIDLTSPGGWRLSLYGKNLGNEQAAVAADTAANVGEFSRTLTIARPRTIGLQVSWEFD